MSDLRLRDRRRWGMPPSDGKSVWVTRTHPFSWCDRYALRFGMV